MPRLAPVTSTVKGVVAETIPEIVTENAASATVGNCRGAPFSAAHGLRRDRRPSPDGRVELLGDAEHHCDKHHDRGKFHGLFSCRQRRNGSASHDIQMQYVQERLQELLHGSVDEAALIRDANLRSEPRLVELLEHAKHDRREHQDGSNFHVHTPLRAEFGASKQDATQGTVGRLRICGQRLARCGESLACTPLMRDSRYSISEEVEQVQ